MNARSWRSENEIRCNKFVGFPAVGATNPSDSTTDPHGNLT
jgi:hypothetical protein